MCDEVGAGRYSLASEDSGTRGSARAPLSRSAFQMDIGTRLLLVLQTTGSRANVYFPLGPRLLGGARDWPRPRDLGGGQNAYCAKMRVTCSGRGVMFDSPCLT